MKVGIKYLAISVLTYVTINCACSGQPKNLPLESKYEEYTTLMMNVGNKFAEETDAKRLHKTAVSTQTIRLITCSDFNDECSLYGKYVSHVVKVSADGTVTPEERSELRAKLGELQKAIDEGKKLLHEAWEKKKQNP